MRLCVPFFNIRPSVLVFLYFFQMKLIRKIGWVSLNNLSKFYSNMFRRFKDHFFKVKAISAIDDRLPLMHAGKGEPRFPFYRKSDPIRFKSFDECLMSSGERVDKAILE